MSLLLNEEQVMLADSAREFLQARSPLALQRELRASADALRFAPALWAQVQELGWSASAMPEAHGGLGVGYQGLGAVFEQMGRQLAALPLLSSPVLCAELLLRAGDAGQHTRWLPGLLDGSQRMALALDERSGRHQGAAGVQCRAHADGEGWRLEGEKGFVIDGVGADAYLVVAREGEALALFVVDAQAAGLSVQPQLLVDSRNHARLQLRGVCVGAAQRLSAAPADAALEAALDRGCALLAAEGLGLLRQVFDSTLAYLKERVQFDVVIGSFQALQHRMARLHVELELLESCVRGALAALDGGSEQAPALCSLAKARASDLAQQLGNEGLQLHGGIGVTDELDLGLFVKRARVIQHLLGDGLFHRQRFARLKGF